MKTVRLALALSVLTGFSGASTVLLYPFELHILYQRFELWRGGVHRTRLGGLGAYEKNDCAVGKPCRCIALIHGLGDSSMTWSRILLAQVPQGTRLVAPDLPGTEDSLPPRDVFGYGIAAQAGAVRSAIEPVCPRWTVAGNSLGGWIGARLALDWPQGVENLVLLDAAGLSDPSGRILRSGLVLAYPTIGELKDFDRAAFAHPHQIPERAWQASEALIRSRPAKATFLTLSQAELLDREIGRLRTPTRIVWGAGDGIVPLEIGRRFHALIHGSSFDVIPNCGHLPQQECPAGVLRALFDN